ncbi:MAG: methyl-accepting chemotaxis protein [Desulfarculus sp.]|nr:methyl-accepting chemotaxis protein [Desulfarculus sp.]
MLSEYISPRRLLNPLREMSRGNWDLSANLPQPAWGPHRIIAGVLNVMLAKLQRTVLGIAEAAVSLGRVAPELGSMAGSLQEGARQQARRAAEIAGASRDLEQSVRHIAQSTEEAAAFARQVAATTQGLHQGSQNIGEIMGIIGRVANQTKLLSLNAAVEAARAGEHGLGFAVVASEIQRLADQTMQAAGRVGEILEGIQGQVEELVQAVGSQEDGLREDGAASLYALMSRISQAGRQQEQRVNQVSRDIQSVAQTAQEHSTSAEALSRLGQEVRELSDRLLTGLGSFRLPAHAKARQVVEAISGHPDLLCLERRRMEAFMRQVTARYPFLELLYVTNSQGRQITENIAQDGFQAVYGGGFGQNWGQRPWFLGAKQSGGTYISDLYRSVASDNFCFTISAPLKDREGRILGVLGADVHFGDLLRI